MVSDEHWYICSAWQKAVSGGRLVYLCCLVDDSESILCLIVCWFIFAVWRNAGVSVVSG